MENDAGEHQALLSINFFHTNLLSFFTWKKFLIFQVAVVGLFHSITPSLPVRHLESQGDFHMKRQGLLVGMFELNS